jgi:hypothetical protein
MVTKPHPMRSITMKKAAFIFLFSSMTAGIAMAEEQYIPWTFDDFDSNCNVIDDKAERSEAKLEFKADA